jgi:hypothetical protein
VGTPDRGTSDAATRDSQTDVDILGEIEREMEDL